MGGRIIGTLFFAAFFAAGVLFTVLIVRSVAANLVTYAWSAAAATVLASEIVPPRSDHHDPTLQVRYAYTFRRGYYESDRIQPEHAAVESADVYRKAANYAVGARVRCYVDPDNPNQAVLERKSPLYALLVLFPLIFVGVGGIGMYAMWARSSKKEEAAQPLTNRPRSTAATRGGKIFLFGFFLLIGSVIGYFFVLRPVVHIIAAQSWIETPCSILLSRVRTHDDSDGDTYSVDIVYRYTFGGRTYTANRYQFFGGSSSGYRGKANVVAQFPLGAKKTCFVNPREPAEAVLKRGATGELWFGLIPLVFAAVGAGGLYFTLRQKDAGRSVFVSTSSGHGGRTTTLGAAPAFLASAVAAEEDGPRTLRPGASRVGKLVGITIAALFWNGIVSVFLYNLIAEWRRGDPSWFLSVFLTPFVLIGLGLLWGIVYQSMALFNPRPRLTVSRGTAAPGDTVEISWEIDRGAEKLRRFHVLLEGREEATYRRGTDTHTDKAVFATIDIAQTAEPVAMRSGTARIQIPANTMHSLHAPNNRVVWALRVRGEIPRWPDLDEEYPFMITPKPLAA